MRNAKFEDVQLAKQGIIPYNVMFKIHSGDKVHLAEVWSTDNTIPHLLPPVYPFMTTDDKLVFVHVDNLLWVATPRKPHPKKPKKIHVKGVLKHLGYQKERIKDGVKVKCRNGEVCVVDFTNSKTNTFGGRFNVYCWGTSFDIETGKNNHIKGWDIVQILDGYSPEGNTPENNKQEFPSCAVGIVKDSVVSVFYLNKYEAEGWHVWMGGDCPVPDNIVEVMFKDFTTYKSIKSTGLRWNWAGCKGDIIAYRIIK